MLTLHETELPRAIRESAAEVLETMFFTSALDEPVEAAPAPFVSARLTFAGAPSGMLQIDVAGGAARALASDFLGCDAEEVSPAQAVEVTGELANMLCGSILSRIEPNARFDLSHPEPAASALEAPAASEALHLPAGPLIISVRLGDNP